MAQMSLVFGMDKRINYAATNAAFVGVNFAVVLFGRLTGGCGAIFAAFFSIQRSGARTGAQGEAAPIVKLSCDL
jgi:hypothetical protein